MLPSFLKINKDHNLKLRFNIKNLGNDILNIASFAKEYDKQERRIKRRYGSAFNGFINPPPVWEITHSQRQNFEDYTAPNREYKVCISAKDNSEDWDFEVIFFFNIKS